MSVALQIPTGEDSPCRLVPIATEAVYAAEWLPVADSLRTKWLQRFQVGAEFDRAEAAEIVSEFTIASERFAADGKAHLAARADAVIEALRDAVANCLSATFFIG